MGLTPETLPRHELNGLHVRVVESTDHSRVGIEGEVVRETTQTLCIGSEEGVKQIPKRGTTFEFRLTDEAAASAKEAGTAFKPAGGKRQTTGESVAYVTVDGVALLSRPATRCETGVDSKWR